MLTQILSSRVQDWEPQDLERALRYLSRLQPAVARKHLKKGMEVKWLKHKEWNYGTIVGFLPTNVRVKAHSTGTTWTCAPSTLKPTPPSAAPSDSEDDDDTPLSQKVRNKKRSDQDDEPGRPAVKKAKIQPHRVHVRSKCISTAIHTSDGMTLRRLEPVVRKDLRLAKDIKLEFGLAHKTPGSEAWATAEKALPWDTQVDLLPHDSVLDVLLPEGIRTAWDNVY